MLLIVDLMWKTSIYKGANKNVYGTKWQTVRFIVRFRVKLGKTFSILLFNVMNWWTNERTNASEIRIDWFGVCSDNVWELRKLNVNKMQTIAMCMGGHCIFIIHFDNTLSSIDFILNLNTEKTTEISSLFIISSINH